MYINRPLTEYLHDLAAKKPAPGGGSASALAGSLGASLLSMVANYTLGKEAYKAFEKDIERILKASEEIRYEFSALVDEDVEAYQTYFEAMKDKDRDKIESALKNATGVPIDICKLAFEGIKLSLELADKGNKSLASDVGVAAELFEASYKGAKMNIDINLKGLSDGHFIDLAKKSLGPMEEGFVKMKDSVVEKVRKALA